MINNIQNTWHNRLHKCFLIYKRKFPNYGHDTLVLPRSKALRWRGFPLLLTLGGCPTSFANFAHEKGVLRKLRKLHIHISLDKDTCSDTLKTDWSEERRD